MITKAPVAIGVPFDNSTNGFTSTEVQSAIEEAKATAAGIPRFVIALISNGTLTNGEWVSYSELLSNPQILLPVKCQLLEVAWSNNNTNLGAFTFEMYKNGQVNPTHLINTYVPTAPNLVAGFGFQTIVPTLTFNAGDSFYVKNVRPSGTALSDLALTLWFVRIP